MEVATQGVLVLGQFSAPDPRGGQHSRLARRGVRRRASTPRPLRRRPGVHTSGAEGPPRGRVWRHVGSSGACSPYSGYPCRGCLLSWPARRWEPIASRARELDGTTIVRIVACASDLTSRQPFMQRPFLSSATLPFKCLPVPHAYLWKYDIRLARVATARDPKKSPRACRRPSTSCRQALMPVHRSHWPVVAAAVRLGASRTLALLLELRREAASQALGRVGAMGEVAVA